ncbi:MAG: hypothetical protein AAB071_01935 [Bacteroidota bacterium]
MSTASETGHAINVANFESLITYCTAYGPIYNPSKNTIKLASLNALLTSAKTALTAHNTVFTQQYENAINARELIFEPLSKLTTRIINALDACNVTDLTVTDAKTIARKIQGRRASDKLPPVPDDPTTPNDESQKSISASQMSFDNRIDNFEKLIQLLAGQPGYLPNETDLKLITLNTLLADMKTKNSAAITAVTSLSNTRIARDAILYTPETGLLDIAAEVKKYVKSVFGATSPQSKQVSGLKFKKPKS